MKKIVITGALGYIGMELCKLYSGKSLSYKIIAIDNKFYSNRVKQLKNWNIEFKQIDILNFEDLNYYLNDADIVYHLAGITDVPTVKNSNDINKENLIFETAVTGTNNIINSLGEFTKLVFPSTHVIFEGVNTLNNLLTENSLPKPKLTYAKSKLQNEKEIQKKCKNFVILRLGSLYGESGEATRLNIMPNLFAKNTALNKDLFVFGGGKQLKSLVSVFDVARCLFFVGEDKNIQNEIFNCVNDNTTVIDVAKICKKFNPNIKIIPTKDKIPNKGYWLDNSKLLTTGFKFHYDLETSIFEMINALQYNRISDFNEKLISGSNSYKDNRGVIENYYFHEGINMIGSVSSKKGSLRGNHYHPIQTQQCLLVSGSYLSISKDLKDKNSVLEIRLVKEGELSIIPPNVAHSMVFLEDSILLNLVTGDREHSNYGITHTFPYKLIDNKMAEFLINSYKKECRACGDINLSLLISLGLSPLANNLLNRKNEAFNKYPLELLKCNSPDCFNVQLSVVIPPDEMFKNYLYLSSTTQKFKNHFNQLANKIYKELNLTKNSFLVDIGSNDGVFLEPVSKLGIKCVGVDPAKNVAKIANKNKLKTYVSYFDKKMVNKIIKEHGKADVVTAFNVFAHSDNLKEIAFNISRILKKNGDFIFEIQYFLDTLKDLTFDNIYHEHTNYWTLTSLTRFFRDLPLKIYKVEHIDTHGGSLRVYCSNNAKKVVSKSVKKILKNEIREGILSEKTYIDFVKNVKKTKSKSLNMINKLKNDGNVIIGYGSPAKATTLLNYFGINSSHFKFTIDDNELKQEKFIPGTDIKILSKENLKHRKIDKIIVLAWNFFDVIVEQNSSKFKKSQFLPLK